MAFVFNPAGEQQLSLFDSYNSLTEREKKFLDRSWAKYFAEYIFPKIDETPYAVLYSNKDSCPNTPVNVQLGALLIKELTGLSDDELLSSLMFDVRFQYALHTTSCTEQPSAIER
ncbi:MAG: transposase [Eubacteriales bacterium]|nr:transposase [Eubacteriales bacterium]